MAVILIDMQKFFIERLRTRELERILPRQLSILKSCNGLSIPVIVLELERADNGETTKVLLDEAEKNSKFFLIDKEHSNGFKKTCLDSYLKELGIKKLFFMGINSDLCVKETAQEAIKRGYEIATSKEVISSNSCYLARRDSLGWFKANGTVKKFICCV